MPFFGRESGRHIDANGGCITPPKMFLFISQFIQTEARNFLQTPIKFFDTKHESKTSIRIVQTGTRPILQTKGGYNQPQPIKEVCPDRNAKPRGFCYVCASQKWEHSHFPLSKNCGGKQIPPKDLIELLLSLNACLLCLTIHNKDQYCNSTMLKGVSKQCRRGCEHKKQPLHYSICNHPSPMASTSISKMTSNIAIPQIEEIQCGGQSLGCQYDTGCGFSLITASALSRLDPSTYTKGKSGSIKIFGFYPSDSQIVDYTEIFLKVGGQTLKLHTFNQSLTGFPVLHIPVPRVWRHHFDTNILKLPHSIDILLGFDNQGVHPEPLAVLYRGTTLYHSRITNKKGFFGPMYIPRNKIIIPKNINKMSSFKVEEHDVPSPPLKELNQLCPTSPGCCTSINQKIKQLEIELKEAQNRIKELSTQITPTSVIKLKTAPEPTPEPNPSIQLTRMSVIKLKTAPITKAKPNPNTQLPPTSVIKLKTAPKTKPEPKPSTQLTPTFVIKLKTAPGSKHAAKYKNSLGKIFKQIRRHLHQPYPFVNPQLPSTSSEVLKLLPDNVPDAFKEAQLFTNLPAQTQDEI